MNFTDLRKNKEGYDDPTAYEAIMRADADLAKEREEEAKKKMDDDFRRWERKCPICGKTFIMAAQHAWKIAPSHKANIQTGRDKVRNGQNKPVCSYSCMRKWEKANGREK